MSILNDANLKKLRSNQILIGVLNPYLNEKKLKNLKEQNILHYADVDEFQLQHRGSFRGGFEDANLNIYIGKRINSNLYLNSKIGFDDDSLNQYQMSYRLNRNESIVARLDEDNNWQLNYRFKYSY